MTATLEQAKNQAKKQARRQARHMTKNVSSLAHEAAQVASDIGGQAVEFGRSAGELGMDAASAVASNVVSAASQLAQSLSNKVPTVHKRRSRKPVIVAVLLAAGVTYVVLRSKKSKPATATPTRVEPDSNHRAAPAAAMAS